MINQQDVYCIGRIGKPHGTAGETTIQLINNSISEIFTPYIIINTDGILVPFFIENYKMKNQTSILIMLEDINSAAKAAVLTGCEVFLPRNDSQNAPENATTPEIIGYKIMDNSTQTLIGEITNIDTSTANYLFEVSTSNGNTILIPAAEELITDINSKDLIIKMSIPEGLLHI